MQTLDFTQVRALFEKIADAKVKIPEIKREFLERVSTEMQETVRANIASRINDDNGHVQSWQQAYVGSRYGYSAVRAEKTELTGSNSHGAVTNYLEHGHAIRGPSGTSTRRYRPRIKVPKVAGRFFYRASQAYIDRMVQNGSDWLARRILEEMGFT